MYRNVAEVLQVAEVSMQVCQPPTVFDNRMIIANELINWEQCTPVPFTYCLVLEGNAQQAWYILASM